MNELKPEDVMKALECCSLENSETEKCSVCPLDSKRNCRYLVKRLALALLRDKDAEIKGLVDGWSKDQDRFEKVCAEKDTEITRLKNLIFVIKQQMAGDLEEIWYEGHGFIEYDDLKRWKEQYIKNGQM